MRASAAPLLALLAMAVGALAADTNTQSVNGPVTRSEGPAEFRFARMVYADLPQNANFRRGWWQQDWPEAEIHFVQNLSRLTRIHAGESVAVRLTDPELFDYPWLYATQVGFWDLGDEEIAQLREYLLRGGFLMADDFWGEGERQVFEATMARLFPERPIVDIPVDDSVLHVVFSIDEFTQIPGLRHLGRLEQLPEPHWRGIYDDQGRLLVAMNHNQDVGDSWEEADTPEYPEPMTALGYRFGINYIVYAMTH